jgi:hypothetical protein
MGDELRTLLRAEMTAERPPPMGDLIGSSVRAGRRAERRRRFAAVTGVAAFVAVAAVAVSVFAVGRPGPATGPASVTAGAARVPVTQAAMLVLLTELLPEGTTSDVAKVVDGKMYVQVYLDDGTGPGMLRLSLYRSQEPSGSDRVAVSSQRTPDNCIQDLTVTGVHPDGTAVSLSVSRCLAWDGTRNQPSRAAVSLKQATEIVSDPRWGLTVDPALVSEGAERFPDLPTFS